MSNVNVQITGARELGRQLRAMGGPKLRKLAKKIVSTAMGPTLGTSKSMAPVGPTGRLRASLGRVVGANRRGDAFSARVGTRRDFTYRSVSGQKLVSGRGKKRAAALAKGFVQDKKTAQQYARIVEFGYDSKGRMRRTAGPARFLERAIIANSSQIIGTVETELKRYINSQP